MNIFFRNEMFLESGILCVVSLIFISGVAYISGETYKTSL